MNDLPVVVSCEGVGKRFKVGEGVVEALSAVDLRVAKGEFVCLSGPSGSGKSTLLGLVGGLESPSSGTVRILGQDLTALGSSRRVRFRLENLGFVFQSYNLVPVLSALENVEYPLVLRGVGRRERRLRAERILERVGLSDRLHHRPGRLSGGQQQRVAVARALVGEPGLVLADEPTANLDEESALTLVALLEEMNSRDGATIVMSSHDPRIVSRCHREVVLRNGRISSS